MPLPVEALTAQSSEIAIREAISQSIAQCMSEAVPPGTRVDNKQKWCAGKVFGMARTNTGKSLGGEV